MKITNQNEKQYFNNNIGDFNSSLPVMDRTTIHKINKET